MHLRRVREVLSGRGFPDIRASGPTRFDSALDGSAAQKRPIDGRMGAEPGTRAPTRMYDAQRAWEIHPSHGSRDTDASGLARFGFLLEGQLSHKTPADDRMGTKFEACPLRCTCDGFGRSFRVVDSQISRLPALADSIPHWTARRPRNGRSTTGWARSPVPELPPACTTRSESGRSIRVTDLEIPTVPA